MADGNLTVREIAELVGGTVDGDGGRKLTRLAPMDEAGPDELTFATDARREARLAESRAGAAIVGVSAPQAPMPLIRVDNVQAAVARLLGHLAEPEDLPRKGVHPSAVVDPSATVSPLAAIGPNVVIGPRAKIGAGCTLCANVTIGADVTLGEDVLLWEGVVIRRDCHLGSRVRVGPNTVIGYDGFGYYQDDGVHRKIPHIGKVVIEDDVEIGACSCVDRAKFGETRIGKGTKIDNLVQVAHNVRVGRGCILAGQCGIAGSAKLGNHVIVMGHAGIRDNISLGDGVQCSAFAAVAQNVADGEIVAGVPARPAGLTLRIARAEEKLPELLKRVKSLETRLKKLESAKDN